MAKNAKSSWVGTTARPQYQTYQTAGLLRPAPRPPVTPTTGTTPTPPPVAPPPPAPPPAPSPGYPPIPVGPPAYPQPLPVEPGQVTPREQLVNAVLNAGGGGGGARAGRGGAIV